MADIAKIELNGVVYNVKDAEARDLSAENSTKISDLEDVTSSLPETEEKVERALTNDASQDASISELNVRVDGLSNQYGNLNATVVNNTRKINENTSKIDRVDNDVDDLSDRVSNAETNIESASGSISGIQNEIDVLDSRIDAIASLPSGSTSGDAELADIRVAWDGTSYASAGDAVRTQFKGASKYIRDLVNNEDLNNLYENGWYVGSTSHTYQHAPDGDSQSGPRIVFIYSSYTQPVANSYRFMVYFNLYTNTLATRLRTGSGWGNWTRSFSRAGTLQNNANLNDLTFGGWYDTDRDAELLNSPEPAGTKGFRWVTVYPYTYPTASTGFRRMDYFNANTGVMASRYYSGGWSNWVYQYNIVGTLSDGDDLNDLYLNGWYVSNYNDSYLNAPMGETTGRRLIEIYSSYPDPNADSWRVMRYYNNTSNVVAYRMYYAQAWHEWSFENEFNMNTFYESYTPVNAPTRGNNVGTTLKVMSYNVAHFNNNSGNYISDHKLFNLKKMIQKILPDVICTQEEYQYIDGVSKPALNYVFAPQYPVQAVDNPIEGNSGRSNIIHFKNQIIDHGRLKFSSGPYNSARCIQYATYAVDDKVVLFISTHPSWNDAGDGWDSQTNIGYRTLQYGETFRWTKGEITLRDSETNNPVTVPTHTHTVICMDSNCGSASDKATLQSIANANGFLLGNGGDMGWLVTCRDESGDWSIDEIAVSNNVIINSFESYMDLFGALYSDHVPVVANLTLK